jgi:hypothetical protein
MAKIGRFAAGSNAIREHLVTAQNGSTNILVLRFEYPEDKKAFCQFHCHRNAHGAFEIKVGLPSGPWPMVGLADLTSRPDDPVLIPEGELTREAGEKLFPDYVVCTSLCGADNAHITDWSPLRGRDVTILPDNDEPGRQYARAVAAQAIAEGAESVRIVSCRVTICPQLGT